LIDLREVISFSNRFSKTRHIVRAFLRDIAPEEDIRTINILLNVYESGIAKELYNMDTLLFNQYIIFVNRLERDYGMSTEAAVEALNLWVDICVKKGIGTRFGNAIFKKSEKDKKSAYNVSQKEKDAISLGINDVIFENKSLRVTFVKWRQVHYINTGNARVATFMFDNKTNEKLRIIFENVSVGGFLNQEETIPYDLPGNQKGINDFNLVYENKVPGNINDFKTVEFQICYGRAGVGVTYIPAKVTSEMISLDL